MRAMFNNKPLAEINEKDIQRLVNHKEQESAELEFKREIASTDKGKKKLAKHVSAMANANGGIIIFGIEEKDSKADKLIGIDAMVGKQPVGEFVNNVLISSVSPSLEVQPRAINLANGKVALVLRVSEFPYNPHMIEADHVYYVRRNCRVVRANAHDVSEMFQKRKSSSDEVHESSYDEVREFLKKRKLDDKDREDFALTPLAKGMREFPLIKRGNSYGYEMRLPFVLFASCPRYLEERINTTTSDFGYEAIQSGNFIWHRRHIKFLEGLKKRTTSESVRFIKPTIKGGHEIPDKPAGYVEIFRNGYVERGLCEGIIANDINAGTGLLFHTGFFVADLLAYMTFIINLYRKIGYVDDLTILIALSNTKGLKAESFVKNGDHDPFEFTAPEENARIEGAVALSELDSEKIWETVVKDIVEQVLSHFNTSIEKCFDAGALISSCVDYYDTKLREENIWIY